MTIPATFKIKGHPMTYPGLQCPSGPRMLLASAWLEPVWGIIQTDHVSPEVRMPRIARLYANLEE